MIYNTPRYQIKQEHIKKDTKPTTLLKKDTKQKPLLIHNELSLLKEDTKQEHKKEMKGKGLNELIEKLRKTQLKTKNMKEKITF